MGWFHLDEIALKYKQVRSQNGGGTRTLLLEKSCTLPDILSKAIETFFPNDGQSKFGKISSMNTEMRDFKGDTLAGNRTVDELYKESKLKKLRVYLYTKTKKGQDSETNEEPWEEVVGADGLGVSDEGEGCEEEKMEAEAESFQNVAMASVNSPDCEVCSLKYVLNDTFAEIERDVKHFLYNFKPHLCFQSQFRCFYKSSFKVNFKMIVHKIVIF
jgi:hypothetical protein